MDVSEFAGSPLENPGHNSLHENYYLNLSLKKGKIFSNLNSFDKTKTLMKYHISKTAWIFCLGLETKLLISCKN